MMRLPDTRRGSFAKDGILAADAPAALRASLEMLLADEPAVRVRLRCQAEDARRGESPVLGSRAGYARPTPQMTPMSLSPAHG